MRSSKIVNSSNQRSNISRAISSQHSGNSSINSSNSSSSHPSNFSGTPPATVKRKVSHSALRRYD